jgi:glycosyltransferase involved in cell wall biosynthesis
MAAQNPASPAHLLHVFPSFAVGGSQIRFAQLVRLHGERFRHTVISLDGVMTMAERIPGGVAVERIARSKIKSTAKAIFEARNILRRVKPDALITYNWGAIEWALANRFAPVARHIHIEDGFGVEERARQLRRRVITRRIALSGHHTKIVLPSQNLETIAKTQWRLPPQSVSYIPNGIECARFSVDSVSRKDRRVVTIGTVAALRPEKNIARLIRIFADVARNRTREDIGLLIVGDGSERNSLEQAARNTGFPGRIVFAGATSTPEQYLARMDIFALTSDTEQMPLSVLEAMASGLPIISFDVGDLPAMVAKENRLFVSTPQTGEQAYGLNLTTLIDSYELRNRLGEANRRVAIANFDEKLMADRYLRVFAPDGQIS